MALLEQGDTIPRKQNANYRHRWERWNRLYRAIYDTRNDAAPAYVRGWGRLLAGLMQGLPIRYIDNPDDPPLTTAQLADLTDDGIKLSSGEGVSFVRWVPVDDSFTPVIVGVQSCDATFRNNQMVDAVVFTVDDTDKNRVVMYTEEYDLSDTEPFRVSVWNVTANQQAGGWTLGTRLDTDELDEDDVVGNRHSFETAARALNDVTLSLVAAPWAFEDGIPVPVYVGNEQAVFGLARLWTQEQEDAEITRRRIGVSDQTVTSTGQFYGAESAESRLVRARFNPRDNVLLLPSGGSANQVGGGGLEMVEFSDDITMRDRIERRENSLLEQIGISPQTFGRNVGGRSDSAAAKRADNQTTMTTIGGPARRWEAVLNDAVDVQAGLVAGTAAQVDVREGLRPNGLELAEYVNVARSAEAMSTRTAVATLNPSWPEDDVEAETVRVTAENATVFPDDPVTAAAAVEALNDSTGS